mgnify:CR=1 FL=1
MPQSQQTEKSIAPGSMLPIRTVANLTSINPVTLRAWERRYNLITPQRTPKGHRLYTEADVELIRQVLELSLIHISEPTRPFTLSRMPSSA